MKTFLTCFSTLAALTFLTAFPTPDESAVDTSKVYVESITYGGNGCPQNTVSSALSDDRTTFTLMFDKYIASSGSGVDQAENRKTCQININLRVPDGLSYAVTSLDYRGYVQLDGGLKAVQESTYYFSGSTQQASSRIVHVGPVAKDYHERDEIPTISTTFSDCNSLRPLNVKSSVTIMGDTRNKKGQMSTDSIDGKVSQTMGLVFKSC